ncbi:MAG: class I SAM-dependent methyltransferase [Candidatus Omnitrophica bacterium]|nr:class I SAM-dependent methyltransferase [Candidatus Omnitrophota bacterium]
MKCRFCGTPLNNVFVSLGRSPLSNSYLTKEDLDKKEPTYPLDVYLCEKCFLVQLPEFESPENIFTDYAYFSSYSDTWLKHTKDYSEKMVKKYGLDKNSFVIEIASNDGCLLENFVRMGIPVLGVEPARNVAEVARKKGVPTEAVFFGAETASRLKKENRPADLLLGNNVLAHVPDINDFVKGMKILLKAGGVITMEFPHLMKLIDGNQFDTIYHEHFSYLSFITVEKIFDKYDLTIFDVEEIPTHGGSLRIYAKHKGDESKPVSAGVDELRGRELKKGYADVNYYSDFKDRVSKLKKEILDFLSKVKKEKKIIVGYGAPAKGNTLLNYCGIRAGQILYTVDRSPHKQGRFLPGSHISIETPDRIRQTKPDYVLILPWNIKDEIMKQMSFIREWGGKFVTFIPGTEIN